MTNQETAQVLGLYNNQPVLIVNGRIELVYGLSIAKDGDLQMVEHLGGPPINLSKHNWKLRLRPLYDMTVEEARIIFKDNAIFKISKSIKEKFTFCDNNLPIVDFPLAIYPTNTIFIN